MKHKEVYDSCKKLALSHGMVRENPGVSKSAVYIDPLGCDLQLHYSDVIFLGIGEMRESLRVFLGGREVYSFDAYDSSEHFVGGYWKDLVPELSNYEVSAVLEEVYRINNTLIELVKEESARYNQKLHKYRDICLSLAKKQGKISRKNERKISYELEKEFNGHTVLIMLNERAPNHRTDYWDDVKLFFDRKFVFSFSWNCSLINSIFDEKGRYFSGEWERFLEKM